jgi:hypothetical protein
MSFTPRVRYFAAICLVTMWLAGCGGTPIPAPTAYRDYKGKDGVIVCQFPEGWESVGGGSRNAFWAKSTKDSALVRINTDLTGSLLGTIEESFGGDPFGGNMSGPARPPAAAVHETGIAMMEEKYGSYEELPGSTVSTQLGQGWQTEFTAKAALGGALHGYRVTVLARDLRFTIECCCRESDWATLQPAFDTSIASLNSEKQ